MRFIVVIIQLIQLKHGLILRWQLKTRLAIFLQAFLGEPKTLGT
jgi:hypothetical protein